MPPPPATQSLRELLQAIGAMIDAGFTRQDIHAVVTDALEHLTRDELRAEHAVQCRHCQRLIVAGSVYQWSILLRQTCAGCGKAW